MLPSLGLLYSTHLKNMMSAKVRTGCSNSCIYSCSLETSDVVRDLDKTVENVNDIVVHSGQCTGSTINF